MSSLKKKISRNYIVFDTETSGLPRRLLNSPKKFKCWPFIVQIAWIVLDEKDNILKQRKYIVKPPSTHVISPESTKIHKITNKIAQKGKDIKHVLNVFQKDVEKATFLVAHNAEFDSRVVASSCHRISIPDFLKGKKIYCTMKSTTTLCKIPFPNGKKFKYPKLEELYIHLFRHSPKGKLHDAYQDSLFTSHCFIKLRRMHKQLPWIKCYTRNY